MSIDKTEKNISKYINSFSPSRYKKKHDDSVYLSYFEDNLKISKDKFINTIKNSEFSKISIEIGSGCGDFFVNHAMQNPSTFCIGADAYRGGIITTARKIYNNNIQNVGLLNLDARVFIDELVDEKFDEIFILFPDPWRKKKHHRRRLLNSDYIEFLITKIKQNGRIVLSSDDDSYKEFIFEQIDVLKSKRFDVFFNIIDEKDIKSIIKYYEPTKYHKKAIEAQRKSIFFEIRILI